MNTEKIYLNYQPIYYLRSVQPIGYEALLRSHNGKTPLQILEEAKQADALFILEREIFKKAACDILLKSQHTMFVNITSEAFRDAGFAVRTLRLLQSLGVSPCRVCIEISEKNLYEANHFKESIEVWVNLGFYTAIDDFGSMRSNIDIIFNAKPDFIKIDGFLVNGVHKDPCKQKLLSSIIETFSYTGIYPILEGLETSEDLDWILSKKWDVAGQGYLLARPSDLLGIEF